MSVGDSKTVSDHLPVRRGPTGDAVDRPVVHRFGADRTVETDRGLVPVQRPPLQSGVPAAHTLGGELREQRPAKPAAPVIHPDEEVFEVDAVHPVPRREVPEPQREPDDFAADLGDVAEQGRLLAEQRCTQLRRGQTALIRCPLIGREFVYQRDHRVYIGLGNGSDDRTFRLSLLHAT